MSNLFQEVLSDAQGVEQRLLGPTYKYYNQIKMPSEIGMSSDGNLGALARDIDGLVQYVEVLVTGNSNASKTGRPLGNKFFLQTGGKCMAPNNQEVDRYIYVNIAPIQSSMYVNIVKSNAVGKSAYKVGLPLAAPITTKNYYPSGVRTSLRRARSGGCVAPKKKGSIYNTSLTNGQVCAWGALGGGRPTY